MNRLSRIGAFSLSLLFISAIGAGCAQCQSDDWVADLLHEVSGSEVMEVIASLQSFGTRDFHTQSAAESADYIRSELQGMGLQTHLQEFHVDDVEVVNVVAVLHPEAASEGVYVVGAHYDSENSLVTNQSEAENMTAPGADDNASGIGVMLEVARVLSHSGRETSTVKFVAFGAEEMGYDYSGGLKGSTEFVTVESTANSTLQGAFVLDMVGYRATEENRISIVTNDASRGLSEAMAGAASEFDLDVAITQELSDSIVYSDHSAFWGQGYRSILIIEELDSVTKKPLNPYYHSSEDTADKLSDEQMTAVAKALLGTLLDLTYQGEDSYTRQPYVVVVAVVVAIIIAVTGFLLRRRRRDESN